MSHKVNGVIMRNLRYIGFVRRRKISRCSYLHYCTFKIHSEWMSLHLILEPSHVKLSIVQGHPTDIREEIFSSRDSVITDQNGRERAIRSSENYTDSGKGYIDLSPVIRVYIQPKAVGR